MQPLQPSILNVLWVDTHGCVPHDSLWTSSGNNGIVALLILVHHVAFILAFNLCLVFRSNIIFKVIEL